MFKKFFKWAFGCNFVTAKDVDAKIKQAFEIEWVKSMQKLEVKDGDIVVVKCKDILRPEAYKVINERTTAAIKKTIPGVQVIVFDGGMDIGVLAKKHEGILERHVLPGGSVEFRHGYQPRFEPEIREWVMAWFSSEREQPCASDSVRSKDTIVSFANRPIGVGSLMSIERKAKS